MPDLKSFPQNSPDSPYSGFPEISSPEKKKKTAVKKRKTKISAAGKKPGRKTVVKTRVLAANAGAGAGADFSENENRPAGEADSDPAEKNAENPSPSRGFESGAVKPARPGRPGRPGRLSLYRKIAFTFIFLVVILLGAVFYFSFVRLKIVIVPSQEKIADSLVFTADGTAADSGGALSGAADKLSLTEESSYPASGEKILSEEISGKVTIYNKYIKNQPLVASTRLFAPDGKLFRTKETVNAPAGGTVEVEIYADDPSAGTAVPASAHFTIPGLWSGLQDKIYAESGGAIAVKKNAIKFVTQGDIDKAVADAENKLIEMARAAADTKYPQYNEGVFKLDESSIKTDIGAAVNDEKENFKVKVTADVRLAVFNGADAVKLVTDKFALTIPEGKQLVGIDAGSIKYSLSDDASGSGAARVKADFTGKLALSEGAQILDPKDLAGLTRAQLEEYLKSKEEIADYEIKFYPSFVRRVPNLLDRINIEILK